MSMRIAAPSSFVRRTLVCAGLFVSLVVLIGCGDSVEKSVVTGKVTYNGQNVTGEVEFVGSDKTKRAASPITDSGTYTISAPFKGEVQVLVKAPPVPAAAPVTKNKQKKAKVDEKAVEIEGGPELKGVLPPPKYATAGNGLKLTLTGGEQQFDIDLK